MRRRRGRKHGKRGKRRHSRNLWSEAVFGVISKLRAPRKKKEPPLTIAEAAARPVRKIRLMEE